MVVDHHEAPAELPQARAILNPRQPGCGFADRDLAACGVVFVLLMAVRRHLREAGIELAYPRRRIYEAGHAGVEV